MGEDNYRSWISLQMNETSLGLYLFCLILQCCLIGLVGLALVLLESDRFYALGIGMGLIAYASAVLLFSMISLRRRRR